jgi:hypothetical protein
VWERPILPPQAGEIVLRVHMGGVCGTDVHLWRGEVPLSGPVVLGHEGIGVVEELGKGMTTDYAGVPVRPRLLGTAPPLLSLLLLHGGERLFPLREWNGRRFSGCQRAAVGLL